MADVPSNERKPKLTKNGKLAKKRSCNPEEWHKQKQKRLRIAGLEYINANGKVVPPKQPGPDCNCRRKCYSKVPEDVRLKTFQGYYSLKSHNEQNAYLFGLMRQVDVKRKRVKNSSRRTCTFEYFVRVKGKETQVCQTAFKNIHAITERKVRVLCKKMDDGIMFPYDNRGKSSHWKSGEVRLPNDLMDQIKSHIYSVVHTHRLKDFMRLDKIAGLEINISKMWKDYIKTYDPENISATLPRSKRNSQSKVTENDQPEPQEPQPQIVHENNFTSLQYPGGGQLVTIAENYFQGQYQTANITTSATPTYFQTHNGQIVFQSSAQPCQPQGPTAYIVLQPKSEPIPAVIQPTVVEPTNKKNKKEKKKGPKVKQWRYTNIFHDEINGAALAAIKTRLGMYFAESDVGKRKAKWDKAPMVQAQTQTINQLSVPPRDNATVTVYRTPQPQPDTRITQYILQ